MGRISLIRGKGHSIAVIYIVKALRLSLRDSLLFMFCLTDSSDSFPNAHWTPYKSDSSFRHRLITFMPNYETFDKWGYFTKGLSGLGGATSLPSKGSHMVWKIGTRSWRASVKELLGIETIGSSCFASKSIGLYYNPKWRSCLVLSFEHKTVGCPIYNFMVLTRPLCSYTVPLMCPFVKDEATS